MEKFDERKKSFEKKFAHDEELIKADLKDHNVSDDDVRNKMKEFDEKAKSDFV